MTTNQLISLVPFSVKTLKMLPIIFADGSGSMASKIMPNKILNILSVKNAPSVYGENSKFLVTDFMSLGKNVAIVVTDSNTINVYGEYGVPISLGIEILKPIKINNKNKVQTITAFDGSDLSNTENLDSGFDGFFNK
jgi:hypothetical protein